MQTSLLFISVLGSVLALVAGHGIMLQPGSRSWNAYLEGKEYCPHCLNAGGPREVSEYGAKVWPDSRHGMCGDKVSEQHWDMPGKVHTTYKQGQVINVDFIIAENHLGRINLDLCDLDAENQQPSKCQSLHRADGKGVHWYLPFLSNWTGGNPGVQLPAYGDGSFSWYRLPSISQEQGCSQWQCDQFSNMIVYRTRWRLPVGSACRHCKLQWHYQSAQNCWPPCEEANRDEVTCENHQVFGVCGTPGTAYPEEFWNCADIRVLDDSSARTQRRVKKNNIPSWESSITLESGLFGTPRIYKMGPPFVEQAAVAADAAAAAAASGSSEASENNNMVDSTAMEADDSTSADADFDTANLADVSEQDATDGNGTILEQEAVAEEQDGLDFSNGIHPRKMLPFFSKTA